MKMLTGLLMVSVSFSAAVAHADRGCRVIRTCDSPVVYVPAYPVVYVQRAVPVYRPARTCYQPPAPRYATRAPRMMAQPGYWVQQDLGCGRSRRLWQPSRIVPANPACSPAMVMRW